MTTLDTKAEATTQAATTESAVAPAVEQNTETTMVITEQQVLFASAAVLAPTPARRTIAVGFASAVRAVFVRPEKPQAPKHYPQRFKYLENAAMSREMDRL